MFKNYIKIAWRTLLKNKGMFFTNVLGLSIGIASCLTITLFVINELSYDRYNDLADRIVRVNLDGRMGNEIIHECTVMAPVAATLKADLPEVIDATRICNKQSNVKVIVHEKSVKKGTLAFVDPNFFDLFTLPLIQGNAQTALTKPNTVILTKAQAETYFGMEDPINKVIDIRDIGFWTQEYINLAGLYTVTGVIDVVPENSHFHFDLFASMLTIEDAKNQRWLNGNYSTYLLLDPMAEISKVEAKLPAIVKKYMGPQAAQALGKTFEENGNSIGLLLQPLLDIHLHSDFKGVGQFEAGGDAKTVYIFAAIALFMLLIACINFMNLATAGASKRVKEIALRKVLGSEKSKLIFQFLSESLISTSLAMVAGIAITVFVLPIFNKLADKSLSIYSLISFPVIILLLILTVLVSLLAGAYPAFFMSSFKPIDSLKQRSRTGGNKGIRSSLVVFQFSISVCLIIATLVVSRQMNYIQNKDLGYEREQLIVMREAGKLGNNLDAFKDELRSDPRIQHISKSAFIPAGPTDNNSQTLEAGDQGSYTRRIMQYGIDDEYLSTMGMKLIAGRNFSKEFGDEVGNILINETAAKTFGIDRDPIGKTFKKLTDLSGGRQALTVVGVVKDFNARSLREPIEPLMMIMDPYYSLIIKAKTADISGLIQTIKSRWEKLGASEPFSYAFLDELYNDTYLKEYNMNKVLSIFALLTIFVACLGLFGLVTFTAEQRFKEIGIRKVLGSSVGQIVALLTKDFIRLVAVSLAIAFPVGYYFADKWLQDFAYRVDIEWWIFPVAGIATILIALVTISYRSIQAAVMNPVKSIHMD